MITLLKWLSKRWKIILIAFTILALLAMIEYYRHEYYLLRSKYTQLETEFDKKKYELAVANESIRNLQTSLQLKTTETEEINQLLKVNYEGMEKLSKDLAEIDAIMYDLSGEDETTQNEEQSDVSITSRQNEAGVDFINRKLQSLD